MKFNDKIGDLITGTSSNPKRPGAGALSERSEAVLPRRANCREVYSPATERNFSF